MTKHHGWVMTLFLGAGLIAGCGASSDPIEDGPKYPDVPSFCKAKAALECTEIVQNRCQTTEDACIVKRMGICSQSMPPGAKYRPSEAEKCLAAVESAYLNDTYTSEEKAAEIEACALLWGGAGTEGSQCSADHNCDLDQELRCILRTGTTTGRCYVPVEKAPGQSCDAPNAQCAEGNFCTESEPQVCANKREVGLSCGPNLPCQDDLRCAGDETSATCQQKSGTNVLCTSDEECTSNMCSKIGDDLKCVTALILSPNEPLCSEFR